MEKAKSHRTKRAQWHEPGIEWFGLAFEYLALKRALLVRPRNEKDLRYHLPGIIIQGYFKI